MSEWLEGELARELAPVEAPEELGIRLGFTPSRRWVMPRAALAVAAAVLMAIGGGYSANRTLTVPRPDAFSEVSAQQAGGGTLPRCDSGAGTPVRVNADQAIVLLAHTGAERRGHAAATLPEGDCRHCHNL
jgi:hypothetical protein